ncbi:MAG: Arc family DNA-binding protein [Anaerolineales bacterium]|nr:Arc family DNA-binding protein [Anaerolineales bacterium]MCX7608532.1 Arc family DNA-binding protein [Anaerolineales bacterium]MDW8226773.1 Arc family DNA-binding protein [Anaerolineales bacterium]
MVAITLKNLPPEVYERVKQSARANRRSINRELIAIIEQAVLPRSLDVHETLERTRRIRDLTAAYRFTDEEITRLKNEGRR